MDYVILQFLYSFCLVLTICKCDPSALDLLVKLKNGSPILGTRERGLGELPVVQFLGISYAQPATGELRFGRPRPAKPWQEMRVSKMGAACVQTPDTYFGEFDGAQMWNSEEPYSEDCLHLNVWTPDPNSRKKLPVLFWIFGGGFYSGSNTLPLYDGKILSSATNTVVVAVNYRVNAFGFLYLGTEDIAGNQGLWDQQLALKWVRENIKYFGGDEDRVTIFGESAGGSSVDFHTLYKGNEGLFNNAILQSSSAIAPWGFIEKKEALKRSLQLAKQVGCYSGPSDNQTMSEVASCLKKTPAEQITENEWVIGGFATFPFVPIIDGEFLTDDPGKLIQAGEGVSGVNYMYGNNKEEGNFFIVYFLTDTYKKLMQPGKNWFIFSKNQFVKDAINTMPEKHKVFNSSIATILHEYTPYAPPEDPLKYQDALDKLGGDYNFNCPVVQAADWRVTNGQTVYMYHFDHRSSVMPWPKWMGVLHGYEIPYIFGEPLQNGSIYEEVEKDLSLRWMAYYGSFAYSGVPDGEGLYASSESWTPYSLDMKEVKVMNTDKVPRTIYGYRDRQCHMWYRLLPELEFLEKARKNPTVNYNC